MKTITTARKSADKRRETALLEAPDERFPATKDQLRIDPHGSLLELAATSYDFADLMRKLFPRLIVQPVQALDSGQVRPRILLTFDLAALLPGGSKDHAPQQQEFQIDCFEPPDHLRHLKAVTELRTTKLKLKEKASLNLLAEELGIGRMTVMRAIAYEKLMEAEGMKEPFRVLSHAPSAASRWKPRVPAPKQDLHAA